MCLIVYISAINSHHESWHGESSNIERKRNNEKQQHAAKKRESRKKEEERKKKKEEEEEEGRKEGGNRRSAQRTAVTRGAYRAYRTRACCFSYALAYALRRSGRLPPASRTYAPLPHTHCCPRLRALTPAHTAVHYATRAHWREPALLRKRNLALSCLRRTYSCAHRCCAGALLWRALPHMPATSRRARARRV